jgi:putative transposase
MAENPLIRSNRDRGECGLWQRRFWEHTVRDEKEFEALCHSIHYNPVKHGQAHCPHAWPYSSFDRFVEKKVYTRDGCYGCQRPVRQDQVPLAVDPGIGE